MWALAVNLSPNVKAIAALQKAHSADPTNAEVLLSLGVSYTNELDQRHALDFLLAWLRTIPGQQAAASVPFPTMPGAAAGSDRHFQVCNQNGKSTLYLQCLVLLPPRLEPN